MRNTIWPVSLWFVGLVLVLGSCEDSTPVGSELLSDGDFALEVKDDFPLVAQTVKSDPLIAFTRLNFFNTSFMLGQMDDPVFGKSESSLFLEFRPIPNNPPNFTRARFDSLVLMMEFADRGFYGDQSLPHDIEVYRVRERMDAFDTILTDRSFLFDTTPIGRKNNYVGGPEDSLVVFDPTIDTTRLLTGVIRIKMDDDFGKEIFQNQAAHSSSNEFLHLVQGLFVRSSVDGSSVKAFDLSSNAVQSNMQIYYTIGVDTMRLYNYPLNSTRSTRFTKFNHNIEGTPVEEVIDDITIGDSPLYMQGMQGVNVAMDLSSIRELNNVFINHAVLEFFVAHELLGDTSLYKPAIGLSVMRAREDGTLVVVDDLLTGIINQGVDRFFGGLLEEDKILGVQKYAMNITNHVKQIYKDQESPYIYVTVFDKVQNPHRIIVFGPEHSRYPAKLRITYTIP